MTPSGDGGLIANNLHVADAWDEPQEPSTAQQVVDEPEDCASGEAKLSLDNPHSCAYCQSIVVDGQLVARAFAPQTEDTPDAQAEPVTVKLPGHFDEAVEAARNGCALYAWFIQLLSGEAAGVHSKDTQEVEFVLEIEATWQMVRCYPIIYITERNGLSRTRLSGWGSWTALNVAARHDDPAATLLPYRPPESKTTSSRSVEFARKCLETCRTFHEECRADWLQKNLGRRTRVYEDGKVLPQEVIDARDLPTRLLHVYGESDTDAHVRLADLSTMHSDEKVAIANAGFSALSYCWGPEGNPVQLNAATKPRLEDGVSVNELPRTIRDAIYFASSLGIRYIWVDALCIFQDDPVDKAFEINRMGSYYGSNMVTICAASASGSSKGIGHGSAASPNFLVGPFQLPLDTGEDLGSVILYPEIEVHEPITKRGWTMQESLLSRRMLIFSHQLHWCCVTSNAECEGPRQKLPVSRDRNFGLPLSLVPGIFPVHVLNDYSPIVQWRQGVTEYSSRELGCPSDKLPAISALAQHVNAVFAARGNKCNYAAGLFFDFSDPGTINAQLQWYTLDSRAAKRPAIYQAPSWSWASVHGQVMFTAEIEGPEEVFKFITLQVNLSQDSAPYGGVIEAYIVLEARLRLLQRTGVSRFRFAGEKADEHKTSVIVHPDTGDDFDEISDGVRRGTVFLLELAFGDGIRIPVRDTVGLVVAEVAGAQYRVVRRIGRFSLPAPDPSFSQTEADADKQFRLALFEGVEQEELKLI